MRSLRSAAERARRRRQARAAHHQAHSGQREEKEEKIAAPISQSAQSTADEPPATDGPVDDEGPPPRAAARLRRRRFLPKPSAAVAAGLSMMIVLGGLAGWLGYRADQVRHSDQQRALFLQVGQQGALNLSTIADTEAEADMKRILDTSTGTFYDQVQQRSPEFVALVKQAQTKSIGTIAAAGIESEQGHQAQVLVAVSVKTSSIGAPPQQARSWRMRITVQQLDGGAKISNVQFVP